MNPTALTLRVLVTESAGFVVVTEPIPMFMLTPALMPLDELLFATASVVVVLLPAGEAVAGQSAMVVTRMPAPYGAGSANRPWPGSIMMS